MNGIAVAGEVAGAGTALSALILVYIGALVSAFGAYQPQEQKTVKLRFLARAWVAFVGLVLGLISAALAILGKAIGSACLANAAAVLLLVAFCWATFTSVLTIREIK